MPLKLPQNTKPFVWGAVSGAVVLAVVGFSWGGWVTGGSANKQASAASRDAVVAVLAPLCVERFRAQGDAAIKLGELTKANSWERSTMIERAGFATLNGSKSADPDVARACAEILAKPAPPKA